MIFSRSPYFIRTVVSGAHTGKVELYIYTGTSSGSWTGNVTYSLTATGVDAGAGQTECIFEVAELIKDKFDLDISSKSNNTSGSFLDLSDLARSLCLKVDYRTYTDTGAGFVTLDTQLGLNAVLGYSTYDEGSNFTVKEDTRHFYYDIPYIYKPFYAPISLMIPKNYSSQVIAQGVKDFKQGSDNVFMSPSTNSLTFIQYNMLFGFTGIFSPTFTSNREQTNNVYAGRYPFADTNGVKFVTTKRTKEVDYLDPKNAFDEIVFSQDANTEELVASKVKVRNVFDCEGYQPYRILFINKYGVVQDLWFFANNILNLTVKSKSYKRNTVDFRFQSNNAISEFYRPQLAQQTVYDKNGQQTITLNSGFYPETFNEAFEQLFLSEYCWLEYNNATLPVVLKDTAFKYRNSKTDGLINHTVTFEFANNYLNNIR